MNLLVSSSDDCRVLTAKVNLFFRVGRFIVRFSRKMRTRSSTQGACYCG